MKNQLNKLLKITIIILFFTLSKSYSLEEINEFTDAIDEAREKFNNVTEASSEQSIIIDKAIKEIDKATEYAQNAIDNDNIEDAIKTLEFVEKSLTDVESIIPQEFSSDMSNIDISEISKEDMDIINELTAQMQTSKEEKQKELFSDLVDLNQKGMDTVSISVSLNDLGVDTIKLDFNVGEKTKMQSWTKEQWAESYNGSLLTSAGSEVITDKEIDNKIVNLEEKLRINNVSILDKRSSITELQTKIDPLENQITDLKTQKTDLLAKYNQQILEQSSTILSDKEINRSKELTDQLNGQLTDLTNQIEVAEKLSSSLQQQAQGLSLELSNEIASKNQLQNNIIELNNQLSANQNILSQKSSELASLKDTDLNTKITSLNERLQSVSREKDFIETDFERSIDLEVEALQRYHSALGDTADEIDFAMREVGVITDADPRKARAFELEKYATFAGFSKSQIQAGIDAVNEDDWDTQKNFYKEITTSLSKNKNWQVDIPSNAELNVMIEEEKAIQAAALASMEVDNIRTAWDKKINEQVKEIGPIASLRPTTIKYAATWEGMPEHEFLQNERNKIISGDFGQKLNDLAKDISKKQNELNQLTELSEQKRKKMQKELNKIQSQVISNFDKRNEINSVLNENRKSYDAKYQKVMSEVNAAIYGAGNTAGTTSGPTDEFKSLSFNEQMALFDKLQGKTEISTPEMKKISQQIETSQKQLDQLQKAAQKLSSQKMDAIRENQTSMEELNKQIDLRNELNKAMMEKISVESEINQQARANLISQVYEAQNKIDEIYSQKNPDLTAVEEKVTSILKEVPTFADNAESLAGLDATTLRARLVDLTNGNKNESKALAAARDAIEKIGNAPIGNLKGPYWEMTNVKAAAIVRSKKYDYVDEYAYINAYYEDPLSLNSKEREEIEGELKSLLGQNNIKLQALNTKVSNLTNELNSAKTQSQSLTSKISNLESELSSLKNSESQLKNQINELSNQFNAKESLISEKNKNLASLQEQLNPISEQMNKLEKQRAELDTQLNSQLNNIANQVKDQGQSTKETNTLKAQLESQIAQLDNELKDYENQSTEINNQLTSLTNELNSLETENPEIAKQIESLNEDLKNFKNLKADLAMAKAKNLGLNVDEKAIKSVEELEGKVVIAIEGTSLVKVVDKEMLISEASKFVDPITKITINSNIYSAEAIKPELLTQELMIGTYEQAKKAREKAVERVDALEAAGASKAEINSAKAVSEAAKYAEIAAGQSLVSSNNLASASVASQKEALENLKSVASTPGMNKFDVRRANAAVKAAEAQIAGVKYDYQGAIDKISIEEQKFNNWRVADYKKEIEFAKANGNAADLKAFTRRLNNFQERLVNERRAFEAAATRNNYFDAISKVAAQKTIALAGSSIQNTTSALGAETSQLSAAAQSQDVAANTSAYDAAKAAREEIDKNMSELRASGASKEAIQAAESARAAALAVEIEAANAVSSNRSMQAAVQAASQAASQAAQEVAQEAAQAAAQAAAQSVAEATLEKLREVANTPGMSQWDVQRAQAAVKAAEAELAGTDYDLDHALDTINKNKAYEEAGGTPNQSGRTWDGH